MNTGICQSDTVQRHAFQIHQHCSCCHGVGAHDILVVGDVGIDFCSDRRPKTVKLVGMVASMDKFDRFSSGHMSSDEADEPCMEQMRVQYIYL